jgi:XTP/dITP diphosphohydrolase
MIRLILATRNRHKVREIQAILGARVECAGLEAFEGAPELVEDAPTFEGNAALKARQLLIWLRDRVDHPFLAQPGDWAVLADDSGLEVDALDGAPGVLSARFAAQDDAAGGNASDRANFMKLLGLLRDVPEERRTARFHCVLALVGPAGDLVSFHGRCEGRIAREPTGASGFGYDPVFVPEGFECSLAELGEAAKNGMSHRAHALRAMRSWLEAAGRAGPA